MSRVFGLGYGLCCCLSVLPLPLLALPVHKSDVDPTAPGNDVAATSPALAHDRAPPDVQADEARPLGADLLHTDGDTDGEWLVESEAWPLDAEEPPVAQMTGVRQPARKDKCLILYHVPKCAGSSLFNFFERHKLRVWTQYKRVTYPPAPPDRTSRSFEFLDADIYMGHWTPEFAPVLRDEFGMRRDCYQATVLRDPLERVASALFFHQPNASLEDYAEKLRAEPGPRTFEYFNDVCRRFGHGTGHWDTFDGQYHYEAPDVCHAHEAQMELSKLDFVFFTADYQNMLRVLRGLFCIPQGRHSGASSITVNHSKNPGFAALPAELQRLILERNQGDMDVYQWAAEQYQRGLLGLHLPDLDTCAPQQQQDPAESEAESEWERHENWNLRHRG